MSLYIVTERKIRDITDELKNCRKLVALLDSYPGRFKSELQMLQGTTFSGVEIADYRKEFAPEVEFPQPSDIDVQKASLALVANLNYRLKESETRLPFGYVPENPSEWYADGMHIRVPFYADSAEGPVKVVTVNLKASIDDAIPSDDITLDSYEWHSHRVGDNEGIEVNGILIDSRSELEISDWELEEALKHVGKKVIVGELPVTFQPKY